MARYAVGDVQGCLHPLQRLLADAGFDPARDELWLAGDLVSRGPDSLETLRFLCGMRDSIHVVLGNHDLSTIALARGASDRGAHSTLKALMEAPDRDELLDWLRHQPLLHRAPQGDYVMTHAGIPPIWSTDTAAALAGEVERTLRGPQADEFLSAMFGNEPDVWSDSLEGMVRLRTITNYFTRMRCCSAEGRLALQYKGPPEMAPEGYAPWFDWPPRVPRRERVLFGHWAALEGKTDRGDCIGLDTGCVWGNVLTLYNLDTGDFHRCNCGDERTLDV